MHGARCEPTTAHSLWATTIVNVRLQEPEIFDEDEARANAERESIQCTIDRGAGHFLPFARQRSPIAPAQLALDVTQLRVDAVSYTHLRAHET